MRHVQKFSIVVWFLLSLCFFFLSSNEVRAGELDDCRTQFTFAEHLFNENDFFRAITEYKRFIFLCPEDPLRETSFFRICQCYFNAGRWKEAVVSCEKFIASFPTSSVYHDVLYLKGMAERHLKRYDDALSSFQDVTQSAREKLSHKAYVQSALIYVDRENWEKAREYFLKIPEASALYPSASIFASGLENMDNLPQKSPALAGTLAAILPGSGHVYTERPRDGLVAFLLNGAFIWAAVELFEDDNYVAGGVVSFFELGWYTGNIYSAIGSAHKYNRRAQEEFIQGLKNNTNLSYLFDRDTAAHMLMLSMKF